MSDARRNDTQAFGLGKLKTCRPGIEIPTPQPNSNRGVRVALKVDYVQRSCRRLDQHQEQKEHPFFASHFSLVDHGELHWAGYAHDLELRAAFAHHASLAQIARKMRVHVRLLGMDTVRVDSEGKHARTTLGVTQVAAAQRAGLALRTITSIETGQPVSRVTALAYVGMLEKLSKEKGRPVPTIELHETESCPARPNNSGSSEKSVGELGFGQLSK